MAGGNELNPRLAPTEATIKVLFALSGNRCAFPGCAHSLVNESGQVVSQISHIKGVKPNAARFDADADAEELRQPENLVILCYEHHIATDDVTIYTVEKMRGIKRAHEARFGGVVTGLRGTVEDATKTTVVKVPDTLVAYARVNHLDLGHEEEHVRDFRRELVSFLDVATKLTPDIRSVWSTIVDRGSEAGESIFELTLPELEQVLALRPEALGGLLSVLTRYDLVQVYDDDGREGYHSSVLWVSTRPTRDERDRPTPFLSDMRHVARALGTPIATLIVDLDWSSFA